LYGIAWTLLTINYHVSRHPNPWKRVKAATDIHHLILWGNHSSAKNHVHIVPHQGEEEGLHYDRLEQVRSHRMAALLSYCVFFVLNIMCVYNNTNMANIAITTDTQEWSLIHDQLLGIHMTLQNVCHSIRLLRNTVNWKSFSTHRFVTQCVMLATLSLILPVSTMFLWICRIGVWGLFGPWMKVVDMVWIHSWYQTSDELLADIQRGGVIAPNLPNGDAILHSNWFRKMIHSGRRATEEACQLKEWRAHLFGPYSAQVPSYDASRFSAIPLSTSTASPADSETSSTDPLHCYPVPGQRVSPEHPMYWCEPSHPTHVG
jgi:hypothetical protein